MKPIVLKLTAKIKNPSAKISERALAVAAMFGIGIESARSEILFKDVEISIGPGDVVLLTGASGAGKSTLLREIERELRNEERRTMNDERVLWLSDIPLENDRALVDCFDCSLEDAIAFLSRAGLSEARILLRSPGELSEGEQFRYRLARFFASNADILVADEFCATLDRVTARVVAHQLAKFIRGSTRSARPRAAIIATTHEDLAEDLRPTVRIYKPLGPHVEIETAEHPEGAQVDDVNHHK